MQPAASNPESTPSSVPPDPTAAPSPSSPPPIAWSQPRFLIAGLILLTLIAFWRVAACGFINIDDNLYVYKNTNVLGGLTPRNVAWAFTTGDTGNFHPLTWLSLQFDAQLWGGKRSDPNPLGYHLTNLAFHVANVVLLYLSLRRMTGSVARSALVAAVFAIHPLRVESVAWISERKDVLSTALGLLALLSYLRYAQTGRWRPYASMLAFYVLSLLAKPMLVTLPFLLLLLDYWPLRRLFPAATAQSSALFPANQPSTIFSQQSLPRLLVEKLPLLAVALAFAIVTLCVQADAGNVNTLADFSLGARIENVPISYLRYLFKMVWFFDLAVYYPRPVGGLYPSPAPAVIAALILLVITAMVWSRRRTWPWLLVGWLWYAGTMVPVIGIVSIGSQAIADRYTYVPAIGLVIAAVWSLPAAWWQSPERRPIAQLGVAAVLLVLLGTTINQLGYWRDSGTVFQRALDVTENNWFAHRNLGVDYWEKGQTTKAAEEFEAALTIWPDFVGAHYNLAVLWGSLGEADKSLEHYLKVVELLPKSAQAHTYLADMLASRERFDEAFAQYDVALQLKPRFFEAHLGRGSALVKSGRVEEGIAELREAQRLKPEDQDAREALEKALALQQDLAHVPATEP